MYIKINDKKYPCAGKQDDGDGMAFSGVTGMDKPPTSGVIRWYAEGGEMEGFLLGAADVTAYTRVELSGDTLTLTNAPVPGPAPEPTPPPETLSMADVADALLSLDTRTSLLEMGVKK